MALVARMLKVFSGFVGLLLGLRHRGPRRRKPHDLTPRQAMAKARIDAALDAGESVDVWLPQRGGSTHLAHVVHSERGGVVVTRSSAAARLFAADHARMFGKRAAVGARCPTALRGMRGPVIIDDVPWADVCPPPPECAVRFRGRCTRPKRLSDGGVERIRLDECACGKERRGPDGGVCGRCGDAIPSREGF